MLQDDSVIDDLLHGYRTIEQFLYSEWSSINARNQLSGWAN
jgi:hypothetical protein